MLNPGSPKGDIGVIVGRFQVHELQAGHRELIDTVMEKHSRVIIFLGIVAGAPTKRNPLDFNSRKLMIEHSYPNITVLPLKDERDDFGWSLSLDKKIREVYPTGKVILYGSRDSFVAYYKGTNETCVLEPQTITCGTDYRKMAASQTGASKDFRAGVIYGVTNH
jgi:bifunctional NMN adenylyltransferase/nudix hydrolase